jgi:5-methylcytosine-specific restriction endonuclease McrA
MAEVSWIKIKDASSYVKIDSSCYETNYRGWARLRQEIIERDGNKCVYCGATDTDFHIDHVFPKARGGTNEKSNLVCSCAKCNMSKGCRTPEEWGLKIVC